ncbi:AMP-binding protein [Dechloromonas sp. XY25]|uniref:AMP-binding protein n=1 Tax=Dechloromonas hankyongensis TaxID=2908002 RepID=A0ABS9JXY2_9RHOO|nr:AMP-binding protein [Dechloromonas hankyongensis]MCG2575775.1 AMP-binding protein [Dechloromonas hankyongensis]
MNTIPLLTHGDLSAIFAWRPTGPVSVGAYLADVHALAEQLPATGHLLNLCHDRYRFAVGFAAGLLRGMTSLQPSSQSPETFRRLQADYPDLIALCDGTADTLDLHRFDFPDQTGQRKSPPGTAIPHIPADQLAAILFTSGSTGLPQAQRKTWGKLVRNGRAEAVALGLDAKLHVLVGTVPVQHSYGFESTFLLALHGGCAFWAGKPFYPQDIAAALATVPQPRLLVTTPFHLSALLASGIDLPAIDILLSATAPLSTGLAAEAEARTGAPVLEIYGSTESGQLASRRTTDGAAWTLLPDVRLEQDGDDTVACDGHVEGRIALSDIIELLPDQRFLLHGRHADLINIAGKRTSLAYLNHQLGAVPGVVDGAFFLPDEEDPDGITRLTAFVVAPGLTARQITVALRERIEAIFLPRPLVLLDALPRNSTGKLPRSGLQALYAEKVGHGRS